MYDVVILTPGDYIRGECVKSLMATVERLNDLNIKWVWGNSQSSIIARARETAYAATQAIDFKHMFWIDSDMIWSPEDFLSLLNSGKDIISGLYVNELGEKIGNPLPQNYGIQSMNWVPFGFLCISRNVADKLHQPFIRPGEYGEDIAFCKNAKDAGFDIWMDCSVKIGHMKVKELRP
jgi:hypothetical protein